MNDRTMIKVRCDKELLLYSHHFMAEKVSASGLPSCAANCKSWSREPNKRGTDE